jgi:protein Xni
MAVHLVLVDALNLIRRIYAVQERPFLHNNELAANTQKQVLFNTQQACLQAMEKIINQHQATHALAVFDSETPCWRYDIFPDYKKGRKKMPQHLADKLSDIQDAFLTLGVDSIIPDNDEADDVISTLAIKVALKGQNVTITSTDKCFLSLLNYNINVYDHFNRRYLDQDHVKAKFDVKPEQLVDLWTLTGDTTNKIPGVPSIGQITAANLLNEHSSLNAVLNADNLKSSIRDKLIENLSQIKLSKQLLTLKQDIELGFNLKDIRIETNQTPAR